MQDRVEPFISWCTQGNIRSFGGMQHRNLRTSLDPCGIGLSDASHAQYEAHVKSGHGANVPPFATS